MGCLSSYLPTYPPIHPSQAPLYAGLVLSFTALLLYLALAKWIREDRFSKTMDAIEEELKVGR